MKPVLLDISDLSVTFNHAESSARAVRKLSMNVIEGEIHGLVGESGSGKTVTIQCIPGLISVPSTIIEGSVKLRGIELFDLPPEELRKLRGAEIGMIFQEPSRYLNPAFTIRNQISEMLRIHLTLDRRQAAASALELLDQMGLGSDKRVLNSYAHELSGGMRQRAMIAMAVSCNPCLLIADEPTTALDVTVERQILELLLRLRDRLGMSVLFVSHNMAVVHEISDRVSVIYLGKIVESGGKDQVFTSPRHPYTRLLLEAIPDPEKRGQKLATIPGRVPDAEHIPSGCAFHPRCPFAQERCTAQEPVPEGKDHVVSCHFAGDLS
ncbi:MAG: ABC transporter ATP-binding protein [Spirochaetales bacterium]|jgi:peptide/nickel transport system ATP-binding protein|nr:ABC transporter ATP-binding protein [Spirochaetales bacterium]